MDTILVAGASGTLGRHVVRELKACGFRVRALSRAPERVMGEVDEAVRGDLSAPESLRGVCDGVTAVFSCAGASLSMTDLRDRAGYTRVDQHGNRALLAEARRAGVERFGYVSLFGAERLLHTEYARAHEGFVRSLRASGLAATVVRPTGFHAFWGELVRAAQRGVVPVPGDGSARTNPVHEADVAAAGVAALLAGEAEVAVGGPEVFTRRELAELACTALGRPPRLMRVPFWAFRGAAALARPLNPRLHALLHFGLEVSRVDAVAPARGARRLLPYFEALARGAELSAAA